MKHNNYNIKLSHYPHDKNFLLWNNAATTLYCGIEGCEIPKGTKYFYSESDGYMTPRCICPKHEFMFNPQSLQAPYWVNQPNQSSVSEIRAHGDAGFREYEDGTIDEWKEIWKENY